MTEKEKNHFEKVRDAANALLYFDEFAHTTDEYDYFVDEYSQLDDDILQNNIDVVKCFLEILETAQEEKEKIHREEIKQQIRNLIAEFIKLDGDYSISVPLEDWECDACEKEITLKEFFADFY